MKSIRDIALEVGYKIPEFIWSENCGYESGVIEAQAIDFAESVLHQYLAQQEPVGFMCHGMEDFSYKQSHYFAVPLFLAPPIKPGFVMVTVEPTSAVLDVMYESGCDFHDGDLTDLYKAMIQAAQEAEK